MGPLDEPVSPHNPGDLFVPLRGEWFDAFEAGTKTWEHRLLHRGWNETNCVVGRRVTLSRGYSGRRLYGVITDVKVQPIDATEARSVYPDAPIDARVISFQIVLGDDPGTP
jgi:hypothetical protein